ncbi:MAG: phosphate ABC transporter substrate-binding protein, partial [Verrucomicrobiota bacterium]
MKYTFALVAAAGLLTGATAADKIIIKGSDTLGAKMVPQLAEVYMDAGAEVDFEIAAEGSSQAFTALLAGEAEIGMSSRLVKDEEVESLTAKGMELEHHIAAYDMIAVIVNSENGLDELTLEDIQGIFTGAITNWSEVGGPDEDISVYTRNTSSGTYKSFQELAMAKEDYGSETQKMAGNEQIATEVAGNPYGIGYVGLAYSSKDGVKPVAVEGVELDPAKAAEYPIARSLNYYPIVGKLSEQGEAFLSWATSDAA